MSLIRHVQTSEPLDTETSDGYPTYVIRTQKEIRRHYGTYFNSVFCTKGAYQ